MKNFHWLKFVPSFSVQINTIISYIMNLWLYRTDFGGPKVKKVMVKCGCMSNHEKIKEILFIKSVTAVYVVLDKCKLQQFVHNCFIFGKKKHGKENNNNKKTF